MAANQEHIRLSDAIEKRKAHLENIAYLKAKLEHEKKQADRYDRQIKSAEDR